MDKYTQFASEALKIFHMGVEYEPSNEDVKATEYIYINTWRSTWGQCYNTGVTGLIALATMKAKNTMRGLFSRGNHFYSGDRLLDGYSIRELFGKEFNQMDDYFIMRYIETGDIYKLNSVSGTKNSSNKRKWSSIEPEDAALKILNAMVQYGEDWYKNVKGQYDRGCISNSGRSSYFNNIDSCNDSYY